ncbi:hypothetical protein PENSPDRAFT_104897 [Peniophora sp. CONT]|nr:hypothetical protein PENSPDRAFT_104897 [Peniophora sp. CONT]
MIPASIRTAKDRTGQSFPRFYSPSPTAIFLASTHPTLHSSVHHTSHINPGYHSPTCTYRHPPGVSRRAEVRKQAGAGRHPWRAAKARRKSEHGTDLSVRVARASGARETQATRLELSSTATAACTAIIEACRGRLRWWAGWTAIVSRRVRWVYPIADTLDPLTIPRPYRSPLSMVRMRTASRSCTSQERKLYARTRQVARGERLCSAL